MASFSLDLEYEDALDFVKFRSRRTAAGTLDASAGRFSGRGRGALRRGRPRSSDYDGRRGASGSSIGALYNYFPDKQSIAFTLVNQYSEEVEAHWKPLMDQAEILTHAEFADMFIERITQFVQERPAYLSLLGAPIRFRRDPAARKASRILIANAFRAKNPSLSKEQSLLAANVGELNRSMQHWLEVYSPGFQSPRSFAGVDLGAELPC